MGEPATRILLVDDDEVDRFGCRRALGRAAPGSYELIEADTAERGLASAREREPALILLDYRLPDQSGLEFLDALSQGGEPPVPVVMLTGAEGVVLAVEAMKRGARDYLLKDTEHKYLDLLPAVIGRILREEQTRREKARAEARLKEVEEALQQRHDEMAHVLRLHTAGEMASAIAHELNQPLHAISAYCEAAVRMVRSGVVNGEKLTHALEQTALQAQRAGHVIRELRSFLRRDAPTVTALDLNELVRETIALLRADSRARGFPIELAPAEALPPVMANRVQIEQVLLNLLRNSVEAMHDARVGRGLIRVRTAGENGGMARVTVSDSGPGLDPETRGRVFEPFFTSKAGGLGMGLAISRTIIEAHGGKLWADPDAGPGATFHFTLRLAA
jgi:C4-dicarboxylate-specific signal transduction histidine kinase